MATGPIIWNKVQYKDFSYVAGILAVFCVSLVSLPTSAAAGTADTQSGVAEADLSNYDRARATLGDDFISPEEIAHAESIAYTREQLAHFRKTLPGKQALEWYHSRGYLLVAGPPQAMSLLDIRAAKAGAVSLKHAKWYAAEREKFSRDDKALPGWIALRKEPLPESLNKNWDQQMQLIAVPADIPNVAELVWGLTAYKVVRDIYLLPNGYVRTASVDSHANHVFAGDFDSTGLGVFNVQDEVSGSDLGISASRKF